MTPEDEETTPEEPWVAETTFGVGGGVVTLLHGLRVFGLVGTLCRSPLFLFLGTLSALRFLRAA